MALFFYHLQAKLRALIHFALYDVVDMFFLPLTQCSSADIQWPPQEKLLSATSSELLQYVVNETHFKKEKTMIFIIYHSMVGT